MMATAKQLAWRKKFAAMAKAGTLRKNPAKRKKVARTPAKKAVRAATRRVALLKPKAAPRKRNPIAKKAETLWAVRQSGSRAVLSYGTTEASGRRIAQALADKTGKGHTVTKMTR